MSIHPGVLERDAECQILLTGKAVPDSDPGGYLNGRRQLFKVGYTIWPRIKKVSAISLDNSTKPGNCVIRSEDYAIWVDLPYHKYLVDAKAQIEFFPWGRGKTGGTQPGIKCEHPIHWGGAAGPVKKTEKFSLAD